MGARSGKTGKIGERIARIVLSQMGIEFIERIHNAWKLVRWIDSRRSIAVVVAASRVSGDFRGIAADGRSVLVEVKTRTRNVDRLLFSDLKQHQRAALSEHNRLGGLSLVVWIVDDGFVDMDQNVFVLQWPIVGFAPRKPLTRDRARSLDLKFGRINNGKTENKSTNEND